jgi:hypothetical protein
MAALIPQPARIPAPPIFNITTAPPIIVQPCLNCNNQSPPEAQLPEQPPCNTVEGLSTPRCKRVKPPVKCKRNNNNKQDKDGLMIVGGEGGTVDDEGDDDDCGSPDFPIYADKVCMVVVFFVV